MVYTHTKISRTDAQAPPIVGELQRIFDALPDDELLEKLKGQKRRGPKGYSPSILWRCYVAYYSLGLPSVSDLIRLLYDNPAVAAVCGIASPAGIPSQPTFSRFFTKLTKLPGRAAINQMSKDVTRQLYEMYPDFGRSVALDATDLKAWSNGAHRKPTDKDAGWVIKSDTNGRGKFVWGYKLHLLVDSQYELPLAMRVTSGNVHESTVAASVLNNARTRYGKFNAEYVLADSGYSSEAFRRVIRAQFRAWPIIKVNPSHKRALKAWPESPAWQVLYNRRTSVERVFGRLKGHRKLNIIRVRGIKKVTMHCMLAVLVLQAQAIATESRALVRKVA